MSLFRFLLALLRGIFSKYVFFRGGGQERGGLFELIFFSVIFVVAKRT